MDKGNDKVEKLQEEGIKDVEYLNMVDKNFIKQLTDNLKRPGGQVNVGGVMVATPDINFGAKSQMRLETASNLVKLYKTVGRTIINTKIQWYPIIKYFKQD